MTTLSKDQTILYGIGAQKGGTTWLFEQLSKHGQVHLPLPKELHYWDTVRGPLNAAFHIRADMRANDIKRLKGIPAAMKARKDAGEKARQIYTQDHAALLKGDLFDAQPYLNYLAKGANGAKVVGDITPAYAMMSEQTFGEMAALHSRSKFIFIMRDPVQRLVSGIKQTLRPWLEQRALNNDELAILARDAALLGVQHPDFTRSDYSQTLQRLEKAVPAEDILCLFFEDLFNQTSMDRITDFLGIDRLQADFGKVYTSAQPDLGLPRDAVADIRASLKHVYDYVSDRFGNDVPQSWQEGAAT